MIRKSQFPLNPTELDHRYTADSVDRKVNASDDSWTVGRRVIELEHLAEQLKACSYCKMPLHLHNITAETRQGFASLLYITCGLCGGLNSVTTGKKHQVGGNSRATAYDINTKAALGKHSF